MIVVAEILKLCRERNYFMRYKNGDNNRSLSLKLLPETIDALAETGFIKLNGKEKKSNTINMSVDPVVAKKMEEFISDPSAVSLRILEKVVRQRAPAQPLTEPGMHCFMRSIRVTSKRDLYSFPSGSR